MEINTSTAGTFCQRFPWRPVVRYDTAHGFAHKDVIRANGEVVSSRSSLRRIT
ncbi:DUF7718 family protein [Candidatus Hakubella thermalkaliphila]